jgi:outer membrane lipoprotein SlyB
MRARMRVLSAVAAAALPAVLAGCAVPGPYGPGSYPGAPLPTISPYGANPAHASPAVPSGRVEYGRITNVVLVSSGTAVTGPNPAGTLIGALAGGVLGNQIGQGGGQAAATVLGAFGGAVAGGYLGGGNQLHNTGTGPVYRIWVQTDSGVLRTFDVGSMGNLRPGDRVRIENGLIYLS